MPPSSSFYLEPYPWTGTWPASFFLSNVYRTTLNGAINASVTTVVVNDTPPAFHASTGSAPPTTPFWMTIDGGGSPTVETIKVTSVGPAPYKTWTVLRAQGITSSPSSHLNGAPIQTTLSLAAGVMGTDGNATVDLGSGRVLWIGLDVPWANGSGENRQDFPGTHSLLGIQTGYDITTASFSWYPLFHNTSTITEFFPDCAAPDGSGMPIYTSGLMGVMIDGTLVLLATGSSNQGPENDVANVAFYVDNPSAAPTSWHWRMVPMWSEMPSGPQAGANAVIDAGDGYVYTWGGVYCTRSLSGTYNYGIRWKRADFKAAKLMNPQIWCGSSRGWAFEEPGRGIIRQPVTPEVGFSDQNYQWQRPAGDFMWTQSTSGNIAYALSANINTWATGTNIVTLAPYIYGGAINYAPYMHPEQTWSGKATNDVLVSFSAGLPPFPISQSPEAYYPHFVKLTGI